MARCCGCRRRNSPPLPGRWTRAGKRRLAEAHENVRAFALKSLRHNWHMHNRQGVEVGERYSPFGRVGLYVPGGTAPLVSTAIMTCTLAASAGVPQIVVTTPADREGRIAPALLCALELAGATEVYKVGGAQAIGALAFGTETIAPVAKIFGPGNAYVVEAKRQVFGTVGIDLLPGPSEILVIADRAANPRWIAADLLAQAEHGADSLIGFLTDSPELLFAVQQEVERQLLLLSRQAQLGPVLEQGAFFCLTEPASTRRWRSPTTSRPNTSPCAWPTPTRSPRASTPPGRFSSAAGRRWRAVISWRAPATRCPRAGRPNRLPD